MQITATKLTNSDMMRQACAFTINRESNMTLERMYDCEHSPIRTQIFWVEMYQIPTFVSVHLVRHSIGVTHFVQSNRDDRGNTGGADSDINRETPVNHAMFINAQALSHMARKRLCGAAHPATIEVMAQIKEAIAVVDPYLAERMVRECEYRRACHEPRPCGYWERRK